MARLEETSRHYNAIFDVNSTILNFVPIIDQEVLGRYRRAMDPIIRQENFGLLFGSILAWLQQYLTEFEPEDHIQVSFVSDALPQDVVNPVCLVKS